MRMYQEYKVLRDEFLSSAAICVDDAILMILKDNYKDKVASKRRLDHIQDLCMLITLLEKRNTLSYVNIEPFIYISSLFINNQALRNKLVDYDQRLQNLQPIPLQNIYTIDNNPDLKRIENREAMNNGLLSEEEISLQQTVLMHLSQRLGRSWRDVARHLNIRECEIDHVQNKYPFDLKEQCSDILKNYFAQCKTGSWKIDLMQALDRGRRRDLKEMVEQLIISTN